MPDDEFTRLFTHMTQRFDAIDKRLEEIADHKADKSDIDLIVKHLDALRDVADSDELEQAATTLQVERHERWIQKASHATGVRYQAGA